MAASIEGVGDALGAIDVASLDESGLRAATSALRMVERRCAALGVRIAARSNELAAQGRGGDAHETLLGTGGVSNRTARTEARRADTVAQLPPLGEALARGAVSAEHVDAVANATRDLDDDVREHLAELAPQITDDAERLPVDIFARSLRRLLDEVRVDDGLDRLRRQRERSRVRTWVDPATGMGQLHAELDPERHEQVCTALQHAVQSLAASSDGEVSKDDHLQAEALHLLLTRGHASAGSVTGSAPKPSIAVVVDLRTLADGPHEHTICRTRDGVDLPTAVVDRYRCDATLRRVVLDERGVPIDVGRSVRTATAAQWAAITAAHESCAWVGCTRPLSWCEAHHVVWWRHGGRTDLDNLVPLCRRHHHRVHDEGWGIALTPERQVRITRPDGTPWSRSEVARPAGVAAVAVPQPRSPSGGRSSPAIARC